MQAQLAEKKEMKARKKRTLDALDYLTKSPERATESEDTSDAEQSVTAAILATLPLKKKEKEKEASNTDKGNSDKGKGPQTRARMKKND